MTTELVSQLRLVRPNAKYEYAKDQFLMIGKVMRDGAAEIERLERALTETHDAWTAETTKRLQAVHERDCAVEDVARLQAKTIRQRMELRRLNKTLRSMWEGVRFKIHVEAAMRERAKHPDVGDGT